MTKVIVWCDICKKYVEVQEMMICSEYYARTIYKLICGHTFKTQISVGERDVCHFEKLDSEKCDNS